MAGWIETYRGSVAPWECDVTEHFTIAYYFDRIAEAEANIADHLAVADALRADGFPRRFDVRFARELRAGSGFHIDSAPIGFDDGLRLGHRIVDSVSGETVTWFEESCELPAATLSAERRAAIAAQFVTWDGPAVEPRAEPKTTAGFIPTARGRVKPGDLDEYGHLGLAAHVHKFTDSSVQIGAAIGLTADYIKTARRGFSTFELALRIAGSLGLGDPYLIETGLIHLGNSSLRFSHRLSDPRTGEEIARLGQFGVQLDLDARRPARLSEELHARAARLVVPAE